MACITWLWLRTLYEVLHEVQVIKIHFCDCTDEILLSVLKYIQNTPRNHAMNQIKKIQILRNKWANSKTKVQKNSKVYFILEIWNQMTSRGDWEIGALSRRLPDKSGGLAFSLDTWHILLYFICCFLSILAQLKHPHVVSFQESFFDPSEETLFIVQVLVIWYPSYEMVMLVAIIIGWVEFDVKNYTD